MKKTKKFYLFSLPELLIAVLSIACLAGISGCSTTQTTTAYKTEVAANIAVSAAMTAWGTYVSQAHPGTNAEQTVWQAFQAYKASEIAAVTATETLATSPTNTPAITQAITTATASLSAASTNLVTVIQSFGVTIK